MYNPPKIQLKGQQRSQPFNQQTSNTHSPKYQPSKDTEQSLEGVFTALKLTSNEEAVISRVYDFVNSVVAQNDRLLLENKELRKDKQSLTRALRKERQTRQANRTSNNRTSARRKKHHQSNRD